MAKAIALVSGGVDSAVAVALALEQGMQLTFLHFETAPLGNTRGLEKSKLLARKLEKRFGKKIKVIAVPHSPTLFEIAKNCDRKYSCVLCRRMMLRVASKVAEKEKANALLTGESLGQVASQTLFNLNAEHGAATVPVLKPLLGMDKLEIEGLAKRFETYDTSNIPSACCSIPSKPSTRATEKRIELEEKKLDLNSLVTNSLKGIKA